MIIHQSQDPNFRLPFGAAEISQELFLAAEKENAKEMWLRFRRFDGTEKHLAMTPEGHGRFVFRGPLPGKPCILWYSFRSGGEETREWQLTVYKRQTVPAWWKDGIVYQIFPDRFAREKKWKPREPAKRNGTYRFLVRDWDTPAFYPRDEQNKVSAWPFWGGTLRGIEEKLPYLQSLGVTVLYLNPIFEAASNHRYDTADYMKIDPLLGHKKDFSRLCEAAKKRGMRIILDGVFNHTGADSLYFDKYNNYGTGDAYRSWYRFGEEYPNGYDSWWGVPDLPSVEESNASYREFLCGEDGVIRSWLRRGASGWRLDVVDEIPDSLVREIRIAARSEKSDSLLLGEVWEDASCKVSYGELREYFLGEELDSTMHYPFRDIALQFVREEIPAGEACARLRVLQEHYPPENLLAALNLIGSHDRERILTLLQGDKEKLKLISFLQYAFPGVPCIYYGDEAGLTGGADPYNRGPFPWGREDAELTEHYRSLARLYAAEPLLRSGKCEYLFQADDVLGCRRFSESESRLALVNRGKTDAECFGVTVPAGGYICCNESSKGG